MGSQGLKRRDGPRYTHVAAGLGTTAVIFLIYSSLRYMMYGPALIYIIIFNFLFDFLVFPLKGKLWRKILLLVFGNLVGLAWNIIELSLMTATISYLKADSLLVVHTAIEPIVNLMWIVCVWSLGLSLLASAEKEKREGR